VGTRYDGSIGKYLSGANEPRDAPLDFGADHHFLGRGERADDVDLAADVTHLRGFDFDGADGSLGRLGRAIGPGARAAEPERGGKGGEDERSANGHRKNRLYRTAGWHRSSTTRQAFTPRYHDR